MPEHKTIKVRAAPHRKDDPRAILNDQDDAHPGDDHHVFIVGTDRRTHEVGDTSRVRELLASGDLVLVEEQAERKAEKASDDKPAAKP